MHGESTGSVRWVLRIEGLCVLLAALLAYAKFGHGWGLFALFFLAPDLSFLGYLAGLKFGSIVYNAAHSYIGVIVCLVAGALLSSPVGLTTGIIWGAHIGFDRFLGYGLKYAEGFGFTHLGRIGKTR